MIGESEALYLEARPFFHLLAALILGLLVGLQRQWADARVGGIRTFALVALLGCLSAQLADKFGGWLVAVGFAGTIAFALAGHFASSTEKTREEHSPLGTEFAMLLMYGIGVMAETGPLWVAFALAGVLAVTLQAKPLLHDFVDRFDEREIKAIMRFVLISLVILPVVPDRTFGPYDVLNPRDIWTMVVLIVAIGLAGFIASKFFGENAGVLLGGLLGGLVSSTATTVTYSKQEGKGGEGARALMILIAWGVLYFRVAFEVAAVAPGFRALWAPLGILVAVSSVMTFILWWRAEHKKQGMPAQGNPSELKTALTFALLYAVVLLAVAYAKERFGADGLKVVAMISGFTDVDAITLSTSRLVHAGRLSAEEGWPVIIIAILSNVFAKGMIVLYLGGKRLFFVILPSWGATLAAGLALLIL